jgi:hypothetical protein
MSPCKLLRYAMLGVVALIALVAAEPTPTPTPPARADAPPPEVRAPNEVKISVLAILATDQCNKIDDRVACIAREVQKIDPKLTGFQVHKMMCRSIPIGETVPFELIDGQTVGVTVDHGCNPEERIQMKIEPPLLGEITYETCCGKFMPIITRYRTADNQLLIIAVRVQPCKCSK